MAKQILIKPIITEKAENLSEKLGQYTFIVNKAANKVEIKNAIEAAYSVSVDSVNTLTMPSKKKSRNTRSGILKGAISSYKKAIIKVSEGEEIDFFGDI